MCLGLSMYFSRKISPRPKAAAASRSAWAKNSRSSASLRHDAHAAAAAAEGGLQDDRVADAPGQVDGGAGARPAARRCRAPPGMSGRLGLLAGGGLVAHQLQQLGGRADEDDAGRLAGPGELGVLGQEAVAGVDGVGAVALGDADDAGDVQVGLDRIQPLVERVGLVGLVAVQGGAVLLAEDAQGADAELGAGPEHADGDLAAVGDEDALELADGGHGLVRARPRAPRRARSLRRSGGGKHIRRPPGVQCRPVPTRPTHWRHAAA